MIEKRSGDNGREKERIADKERTIKAPSAPVKTGAQLFSMR